MLWCVSEKSKKYEDLKNNRRNFQFILEASCPVIVERPKALKSVPSGLEEQPFGL